MLKNVSALVTGGASGLGLATVRRIVANGGSASILDLASSPGKAVAAELGDRCRFFECDITQTEQVEAAIAGTQEAFGLLNASINCAGIGIAVRTLSSKGPHPLDSFQRVINVNLVGTFNVVRLSAQAMAQNDAGTATDGESRGVIVQTASVAAFDGQCGQAAYTASKAALAGMTLPLARDLAKSAIRVCTIAPGLFRTPLLMSLPDKVQTALAATVPYPARLGNPDEYAMLVESIVLNPMLNGETIRIDGAIRMMP